MTLSKQLSEAMRSVQFSELKKVKASLATVLGIKDHNVSSDTQASGDVIVYAESAKANLDKAKKAFPGNDVTWSNGRIYVSLEAS